MKRPSNWLLDVCLRSKRTFLRAAAVFNLPNLYFPATHDCLFTGKETATATTNSQVPFHAMQGEHLGSVLLLEIILAVKNFEFTVSGLVIPKSRFHPALNGVKHIIWICIFGVLVFWWIRGPESRSNKPAGGSRETEINICEFKQKTTKLGCFVFRSGFPKGHCIYLSDRSGFPKGSAGTSWQQVAL